MKKNLFFAALMVVAMGGGLAACGTSSSLAPAPTAADAHFTNVSAPITVWAPAEEKSTFDAIVAAYNANQTDDTAKFNCTYVSVSESDGGTTLAADPTVTGYPALVAAADDQLNTLIQKKIINPLSGGVLERTKTYNSEASVGYVTFGDNVYGFPITADNGYFMWYDSTLMGDTDITDLSAILAKAKTLGKKVSMKLDDGWYASQFFYADGVCGLDSMSYSTDDAGALSYSINWDNEAGVAMATAANKLLQPYYTDGTLVLSDGNDQIWNAFNNEEGSDYLMAESGLWMEKGFTNKNMAAADLPSCNGHHLGSFVGAKAFVVNAFAKSEEQRAALYLGDLLTRKDSQLLRFKNRASIPCNVEAAADDAFTKNISGAVKAFNAQASHGASQGKCAESRYWDRGKEIGKAIADGVLGNDADGNAYTWQTFLTAKCDMLRKKI